MDRKRMTMNEFERVEINVAAENLITVDVFSLHSQS